MRQAGHGVLEWLIELRATKLATQGWQKLCMLQFTTNEKRGVMTQQRTIDVYLQGRTSNQE